MFKKCMSTALMFLLLFLSFDSIVEAKTYKKKNRASYSYSKKNKKNKSKKAKKRGSKLPKRYKKKRSGNGPDLRALTTEKSDTEYTETPDNGVNSVETKTEL